MLIYNARTLDHLAAALAPRIAAHLTARPRPGDAEADLDELLTEAAAAALLNLRPGTLATWRGRGHGPRFLRLGGKRRPPVRYRLGDLLKFRDARVVNAGR